MTSLLSLVVTAENFLDGITSGVTGDESLDDEEVVVIEDALMLAPSEPSVPLPLPRSPSTVDEEKFVQICILGKRRPLSDATPHLQHNNRPRNTPASVRLESSIAPRDSTHPYLFDGGNGNVASFAGLNR